MCSTHNSAQSYSLRFIFAPIAFVISTLGLWVIVNNRPSLENEADNTKNLSFPTSLEDVKKLFVMLASYKENNSSYIFLLFSAAYIYKQSFAIPGSALLNILAGAIFGCWPFGLILCSTLTAVGATNCFLLSKFAGRNFIMKKFPAQIAWLKEKLIENEGQLFLFLISLRLFPATPNWLINIIAPIVNIPIHLFFFSVLIGLLPYNFLCIMAGETLSEINSVDEVFTPQRLLMLLFLAVLVFISSRFASKRKVKFK